MRHAQQTGNSARISDMDSQAEVLAALRRGLAGPLPGLAAQLRMAPEYRKDDLLHLALPGDARPAGVLILLYPGAEGLTFTLIRRTDTVEYHRGQISLPGGAREAGESLEQTALREAFEEVGVEPGSVEMLGELTPLYIPVSGFRVQPFVAYSSRRPDFQPDPVEVAEVIEVPLEQLLDPRTEHTEVWERYGQEVPIPLFQIGPHQVWGATAMILAELQALCPGPFGSG
jgi:8-oxo-dGTP pyrophosphatase MutT (NUDIX family)